MIVLEMQQQEISRDGNKNIELCFVWKTCVIGEKFLKNGLLSYRVGRRPIGPQRAAKKRRKL